MMGQETRNKLTDHWKERGVKQGDESAVLTNIIHQEWSGVTVKDHKAIKGLKTQNLRGHMTEAELIFTALAELGTRQIVESEQAVGMPKNKTAGKSLFGISCGMTSETIFCSGDVGKWEHSGAYVTIFRRSMGGKALASRSNGEAGGRL